MADSLKQKTVNGLIWSAVERFSTQGVQFLFSLVLARLLTPHDYGIIGMLAIFMAVSQVFIDSGFSNALIRKTDRTETDNSTAFYFNIVVGGVAYCFLWLISPWIAGFFAMPILEPLVKVVALNVILNSLCVVQTAQMTLRLDFRTQAKISLTSAVIAGLVGIALAWRGYGVWALAWQGVASGIVRSALLWWMGAWRPKKGFSWDSFRDLFCYGSKLLVSALLETVFTNLYQIIIGKFFDARLLGLYTRAQQFATLPSSNVTGVIQRVTFPVLSTIQNEDERLCSFYRRLLKMSAFIIFPMMTMLAAVAAPLVEILLTAKWNGCIILLQIICFNMMWHPIHAINLNLLQVKGRSDLFLKLEIAKKILGIIILCVTVPFGLIAMCVGQVVSSYLCLIINTYYTGKLIRVGYFMQMRDVLPILANSLVLCVLALGAVHLTAGNLILQLTAGCLTGSAYYIVSNALLRTDEYVELVQMVKRRKDN